MQFFSFVSRDDWIRTSGPYVPNVVLYQTEPHPDILPPEKKCIEAALNLFSGEGGIRTHGTFPYN